MIVRAGGLKEGEHATVNERPQEEHDDEHHGKRRPPATTLFSSPASALFLSQLVEAAARPNPRQAAPALMWARRLCGRWLLAQRLRWGIAIEAVAEQVRVDAETVSLLELGLATDIGADEERLERLAVLLADPRHDADLVMAVLRVASGVAALSPELLERVAGEVRPPEPVDDRR